MKKALKTAARGTVFPYQNRTYKAHGRALLRMAEILKETEAPAVKGSKRQ